MIKIILNSILTIFYFVVCLICALITMETISHSGNIWQIGYAFLITCAFSFCTAFCINRTKESLVYYKIKKCCKENRAYINEEWVNKNLRKNH